MNALENKLFKTLILLAVVVMSISTVHAKKELQWQSGTLLDSNTQTGSRLAGVNGTIEERRNDRTYYQIETAQYSYVVSRTLLRRHDKPLNVTINGPIQFAIDGEDVYVKDDTGTEHKLTLEKKIVKSTQAPENHK
jgi:hypothetical protein